MTLGHYAKSGKQWRYDTARANGLWSVAERKFNLYDAGLNDENDGEELLIVQIRVQEDQVGSGVFRAVYSDIVDVDDVGDDLNKEDKIEIRIHVVYPQSTWDQETTQEPTKEDAASKVNETQEL